MNDGKKCSSSCCWCQISLDTDGDDRTDTNPISERNEIKREKRGKGKSSAYLPLRLSVADFELDFDLK